MLPLIWQETELRGYASYKHWWSFACSPATYSCSIAQFLTGHRPVLVYGLGVGASALVGKNALWVSGIKNKTGLQVHLLYICTQYKYLRKVQNTDFSSLYQELNSDAANSSASSMMLCNFPPCEKWKVLLFISKKKEWGETVTEEMWATF